MLYLMSMRRTLTAEQQTAKDERRARFRAICRDISEMSDDARAELAAKIHPTTVEGHPLSIGNACLLAVQCESVTIVGGYQQWKAHGRQVRKGEHGLMIWVPTFRKNDDAKPATGAELAGLTQTDDTTGRRFIAGTVFDVSQTDPMAGENLAAEFAVAGSMRGDRL